MQHSRAGRAESVTTTDRGGSVGVRPAPTCILCGSEGTLEHANLVDRLFGAPGVWGLRRCSNHRCRLGWSDPQPQPGDIWKLYRGYWTHGAELNEEPHPNAEVSGDHKSLVRRVAESVMIWRREAFRSDSRYLTHLPPGRLLDVGCGTGDFLGGMAELGWQATGTDFDEAAVSAARRHKNIKVYSGGLLEQHFPKDAFDAITLSHVIEHVPDPLETFAELKRILAPGGRLVIVTPNVNSLGHKAFGRCWRGLEPPRHLHLFTDKALKSLAKKAGLNLIACFAAAAAESKILEVSTDLWKQSSRSAPPPNARRLYLQEKLLGWLNVPVGEFLVLLATK